MRKDMKKVLVTTIRPRGGRRNHKNMRYRRERLVLDEYEDEDGNTYLDLADSVLHTTKTGIKNDSYDRKYFGENLNPLARFIRSNVGRPWNKVYSEICEHCNPSGAVSGHIFDHIWDLVIPAHKVFFKDGEPWYNSEFGPRHVNYYAYSSGVWGQFYVHPKDGTLREAEKNNRINAHRRAFLEKEKLLKENTVKINDNLWACRNQNTGVWFLVSFREQQYIMEKYTDYYGTERSHRVAVHSAIELSEDIVRPKLKSGWIPVSCKTASKKEIRDYIGGRNG